MVPTACTILRRTWPGHRAAYWWYVKKMSFLMPFPSFWVSKWIFFKNWNINLILLLESFPMLFTDLVTSSSCDVITLLQAVVAALVQAVVTLSRCSRRWCRPWWRHHAAGDGCGMRFSCDFSLFLGFKMNIFQKLKHLSYLSSILKSFPMLFTDFKNSSYIKSYEQKTAKF